MGIEMTSPRQPWDPDVPPFTYSKYASAFMNTIHVIQRDMADVLVMRHKPTDCMEDMDIWRLKTRKQFKNSSCVYKKSQSIKRIIIINQNSSGF